MTLPILSKSINFEKLTQNDLPLIVLADDRRSWIAWLIKKHSRGNYNHIMEMHKPGLFASQNPGGYKEISISKYLKPHITLKAWKYKPLTEKQKIEWLDNIQKEVNEPWRLKGYDYLGIIGQLTKIRWINNPWKKYCSERVGTRIRNILEFHLPKRRTPAEINRFCKRTPGFMCLGKHDWD